MRSKRSITPKGVKESNSAPKVSKTINILYLNLQISAKVFEQDTWASFVQRVSSIYTISHFFVISGQISRFVGIGIIVLFFTFDQLTFYSTSIINAYLTFLLFAFSQATYIMGADENEVIAFIPISKITPVQAHEDCGHQHEHGESCQDKDGTPHSYVKKDVV